MYAGLLAMVIKGTMAVGGVGAVFETAEQHGRLAGFLNIDPNPLQYITLWTAFFGGIFFSLSAFGANQIALQRYCSLPTLNRARAVLFVNGPMLLMVMSMVFYIGLAMFAYSAHCLWRNDDLDVNKVSKDQLVIFYMLDLLGETYGLPGLYVACIFSATLSTVSSSINSLSAVLFEDFIRPLAMRRQFSQHRIGVITKITAGLYGVIAVCLAFGAAPLGGILKAVTSACGVLSGPLVGLILLGILFPFANRIGAITGTIVATCIDFWIFIGAQIYRVEYTPLSGPGECRNGSIVVNETVAYSDILAPSSVSNVSDIALDKPLYTPALEGVDQIYALSFFMHACVGAGLTMIVGLLVSVVTGCDSTTRLRPELSFWTRNKFYDDSSAEFEIGDEQPMRNGNVSSIPDLRKRSKKRSNNYDRVEQL